MTALGRMALAALLLLAAGPGCTREEDDHGHEAHTEQGDFERGPLVQTSDVMVWHASPRAARRGRR